MTIRDILFRVYDKGMQHLDCNLTEAERLILKAIDLEWIPVEERLPDSMDDVLTTDGVQFYIAAYFRDEEDWLHAPDYEYVHESVTHWMPILNPPKS